MAYFSGEGHNLTELLKNFHSQGEALAAYKIVSKKCSASQARWQPTAKLLCMGIIQTRV